MKIYKWLGTSDIDTFRLSLQYIDDNFNVFILYVDIDSTKTVGDFRAKVRQWERTHKNYHAVPFSKIEWEQNPANSEYIRPENLKRTKYEIIN